MPTYDFIDDDTGETIEVVLDSERAPSIGTIKRIEGRRLRRLPPAMQPPTMGDFTVTAWSQRPNSSGAQHYNKDGVPVLHGKSQVNDFLDAQRKQVETDGVGETQGEVLGFDGHKRL